ncbi:hypothetical protein F2Q70_00037349 [Brassica cretica]|uniref:Uncharacterized protein n=1 Tax=Brassica cretica TaxID=69181 RepID=A0A8S9G2L4_BRACR|nr:hypothetical protein F2Q68_00032754 [Brassica cretica]KAF2585146.1 hypothetical protein F2Q70_00037349 [Brassica cretica]
MFFWPEFGRRAWMSQSWRTTAAFPKMNGSDDEALDEKLTVRMDAEIVLNINHINAITEGYVCTSLPDFVEDTLLPPESPSGW